MSYAERQGRTGCEVGKDRVEVEYEDGDRIL